MAREVVWTNPGWDDLEAAAKYIARDSEFYAATFVQEARDAASSLADFAERGQVVPEFDDESIRELLLKPYRLVYKVTDEHVFIVAFIHGSQRLWRI
jgi:plasmid stabilization system protein ParE